MKRVYITLIIPIGQLHWKNVCKKSLQTKRLQFAKIFQRFIELRNTSTHYITKDKDKATSYVYVDKEADTGVKIIKELKDSNNTHKYTMKTAIKEINRRLQSEGIDFKINQYIFNLFNKKYGIKDNEKFCYVHKQYAQPSYTYSVLAIELIVGEIKNDSENIVENLKRTKK